jgi:2-C-methyl-D-erythritol 2,4-cyclodiphosphate synthase
MTRIGLGYDIHRLAPGRKLFLGGIRIPFRAGLLGHSDGDALIHALIDAILGAMGEGDIGRLFPDTDARTEGIRSTDLLRDVMARLKKKKWRVAHADVVVVAERPKIGPHVDAMKATLCPLLGVRPDHLGIKPKTNEGLDATGRGEAIYCWAVVVLGKKAQAGLRKKA